VLSISPALKIFLYAGAADLRRGYDGLAALVQNAMDENPLSGHLYLFINRRRNRIKLLYWAGDGYAIWMKRLERGSFELPRADESDSKRVKITASQLALILEGIELSSIRQRKRYRLSVAG
jgi:transposase